VAWRRDGTPVIVIPAPSVGLRPHRVAVADEAIRSRLREFDAVAPAPRPLYFGVVTATVHSDPVVVATSTQALYELALSHLERAATRAGATGITRDAIRSGDLAVGDAMALVAGTRVRWLEPLRDVAYVLCGIDRALRGGELESLQRPNVTSYRDGTFGLLVRRKPGRWQTVHIGHSATCPAYCAADALTLWLAAGDPQDAVFCGSTPAGLTSTPVTEATINRRIAQACQFTASRHTLRHTAITYAAMADPDPVRLAVFANCTVDIAQRYMDQLDLFTQQTHLRDRPSGPRAMSRRARRS
jgi:hypothetical protein